MAREPKTKKTLLKMMRARLDDPKAWTKGAYARDEKGNDVGWDSEKAVCWCIRGCAHSFAGPEGNAISYETLDFLDRLVSVETGLIFGGAMALNDEPKTQHQDILNLLDKAIANG